jgi:hypothetical protein
MAPYVQRVHVMDLNVGDAKEKDGNIVFHRSLANYETLAGLLKENPQITHVASVSVFEHIPHETRCEMIRAINESFAGDIFATTLEYHPRDCFFEHQLTVDTLSKTFTPFTNFYPDRFLRSPVLGEIAYGSESIGRRILRRLGQFGKRWKHGPGIPLWYPLALRFRRMPAEARS